MWAPLSLWGCYWCFARMTWGAGGKSTVSCPAPALKPAMAPYCHQSKSNPIFGVWILQTLALLWLLCLFLSAEPAPFCIHGALNHPNVSASTPYLKFPPFSWHSSNPVFPLQPLSSLFRSQWPPQLPHFPEHWCESNTLDLNRSTSFTVLC